MLHHGRPTGVVILSNNVVLCCINARCFLLYAGNFLSHIFPLFGISILPKNPYINLIEVCQAYTYQLGFFTRGHALIFHEILLKKVAWSTNYHVTSYSFAGEMAYCLDGLGWCFERRKVIKTRLPT